MAKAWMPGAERIEGGAVRTATGGGAPRAVWTVTGSDPNTWSAREEAHRLVHKGESVHLVWNPLTGAVAQTLAATRRSGLALGSTSRHGLCLEHGDEGRVCLVVAVVATEEEPFTGGPLVGLAPIVDWLESWGVSRNWPAGPPGVRDERSPSPEETVRVWSRGGHFGHGQVPGSLSTAPGRVAPERVLAAGLHGTVPAARPPQLSRKHPGHQPSVTT
ncbi:hypothetical protein H4W79_003689 [Nocardiopsis terrae]|uniref:Uncharacterized protein n=1 Tax=Nocardiopsis terrae TaxID=372655 RepID=A0ABR9HKB8_9ACTN|nr:hypothetical protein [Nocardiopsis terrae]MBE1459475.1 hypothetical protein [Nocardiopsis terrae]